MATNPQGADEAEARLALFARAWAWQHGTEPGAITDAIIPEGGYAGLYWADIRAIREDRKRLLERVTDPERAHAREQMLRLLASLEDEADHAVENLNDWSEDGTRDNRQARIWQREADLKQAHAAGLRILLGLEPRATPLPTE